RGDLVRLDPRRRHRQDEHRLVPRSEEHADPRPSASAGGDREGKVRGGGDAHAEGRRYVPGGPDCPSGPSGRSPSRLHGDDEAADTSDRSPGTKAMVSGPSRSLLIASVIPVLVGALAAWTIRSAFDPSFFVLCLLGAMSIHLGANMANDAWDYRSGNDLAVRHLNPFAGGGRVLLRGVLSTQAHLAVSLAFLAAGSLIGLYLVAQVGLPLFVLGLFGVAIAYSYVGPPFRLAHHGLGEIAVALEFGPVTVLGTYFVLARAFDPPAIVLSLSLGLLVAGI